jgi:hypothetical protein
VGLRTGGGFGDAKQQAVELLALVVVEDAERTLVLSGGDLEHVADGVAAAVGEVDVPDAPVAVAAAALGEAEALEVVDQADHRALVDAQAPSESALGHRTLGVDHGEHRSVLGTDTLARERALEPLGRVFGDEGEEITRPVGK